jgi:uncharacterized RDD family membrane protein YckC
MSKEQELTYIVASTKDRLAAFFINLVIFLIALSFLNAATEPLARFLFGKLNYFWLLFFNTMVLFSVNSYFVAKKNFDPGKYLFGLKIANYHGNRYANFWQGMIRVWVSYISTILLGLGNLSMIFNSERLTLQDIAANTLIIEKPKYDRKGIFYKIFRNLFFVLSLVTILTVVGMLIFAPTPLLNNYFYLTNITSFNGNHPFIKEEDKAVEVPISNGQIYALVQAEDEEPEYVDFSVDPRDEKNYLSKESLERLNIAYTKTKHYYIKDSKSWWGYSSVPYVKIPKLIFKDRQLHDITVYNLIFHIHRRKNSLGTTFLDLFDYKYNPQASADLVLGLKDIDQDVYQRSLSDQSKAFLSSFGREIREKWRKHILESPVEVLERLAREDASIAENTEMVFQIEVVTNSGRVANVDLKKRSAFEDLDAYATKFVSGLTSSNRIPNELQDERRFTLTFALDYFPDDQSRLQQAR